MKSLRCLIITTSNYKLVNTTNTTGVWLEDLAAPYFIFKDSGEHITLATPNGGLIPLDMNSQSEKYITENTKRFRENDQAMYHFSHSLPLNEIKAENFDLVFFSGAYGAMLDFDNNEILQAILSDFYYQNKPISNSEESSIGIDEKPPFLLETKLRSSGAFYSNGPDFKSNVVIDGSIITGQNPASSLETARQTLMMAHKQHTI